MVYSNDYIVKEALNINPFHYHYNTFSMINGATNEDLQDSYHTIGIYGKDILVPASSGDQFITSKLLGAKNVVIYDINLLTKYFTFLKIAAGKYFSDYEHFQRFIVPNLHCDYFLNQDDFCKISDYLPDDIAQFWYQFLHKCNLTQLYSLLPSINSNHLTHLQHLTPFYSPEGFERSKSIWNNLEYPEFVLSDLKNLPTSLDCKIKTFDFIDCSNIIECEVCQSIQSYPYPSGSIENFLESEWIDFIQNNLSTIVNPNGKVIVDYRVNIQNGLEYETDLLFNHENLTPYILDSNFPEDKSAIVVYQKK